MQHVLGIKTVVPEFVHDYFESREVVAGNVTPADSVDSQKESGLAQLVFMGTVAEMSYRADCEDDTFPGRPIRERVRAAMCRDIFQQGHGIVNAESYSGKLLRISFQTVRYYPVISDVTVAPAGTECYDKPVA